jgi:hypothetical protein
MRFGCGGCLGLLLLLLGVAVVGVSWTIARCLRQPDLPVTTATAVESRRAQQKLAEMFQRPRSPGTSASDLIVFSEGELNALLARNVEEVRGARLGGIVVRLVGNDQIDVYQSLSLTRALDSVGLAAISHYLPDGWRAHPVWWHIATRLRNTTRPDGRRGVALDVAGLALGRQPLPAMLSRILLDPKLLGTLSFELPAGVDGITIEPGKALVRRPAPAGWRQDGPPGLRASLTLSLV